MEAIIVENKKSNELKKIMSTCQIVFINVFC